MDSKETLDAFLKEFVRSEYEDALKYVQLTFRNDRSPDELITTLKNKKLIHLISYEIIGRHMNKGMNDQVFQSYDVKFCDRYNKNHKCVINVLCEKEPYLPSEDGQWGVNPMFYIPMRKD